MIDPVELPELTNVPSSVVSPPEAAMLGVSQDQVIVFDVSEGRTELVLPVLVRDNDLYQDVQYQVWVDYVGSLSAFVSEGVLLGSGKHERSLTVRIPALRLSPAPSCHRIEVLASSQFDSSLSRPRDSILPNDVAQGVWWVRTVDSVERPGEEPTLSECPR